MSLGYDLFDHDGTGYLELQKDDEEAVYISDDAAWAEFIIDLRRIVAPGVQRQLDMACRLLKNWREPMARVMRGEDPNA